MRDFTLQKYLLLITKIISKNYNVLKFGDFIASDQNASKILILRHDVDRLPKNALKMAQLEYSAGIKGTYYFRIVSESYDREIMNKIVNLGCEIGYHYEDVDLIQKNWQKSTLAHKKNYHHSNEELIDAAYESFCVHLAQLRENFDIKTICMHGSPLSRFDNRMIWEKYDYKELGIIGEPYLDINYSQFAYFTDTGRGWNNDKVSVRDKVNSKFNFNLKTTQQIIDNVDQLPLKIMLTIHPQRWHNNLVFWSKELVLQKIKNFIKEHLIIR